MGPDDDTDDGLESFLKRLKDADMLNDDAAGGVAKKAAADGMESLTGPQRSTLETYLLEVWRERRQCSSEHCDEILGWDDIEISEEDSQLCGRCQR